MGLPIIKTLAFYWSTRFPEEGSLRCVKFRRKTTFFFGRSFAEAEKVSLEDCALGVKSPAWPYSDFERYKRTPFFLPSIAYASLSIQSAVVVF
jgi:hypothetical protein